jgi:hypothetical protein
VPGTGGTASSPVAGVSPGVEGYTDFSHSIPMTTSTHMDGAPRNVGRRKHDEADVRYEARTVATTAKAAASIASLS